MVKRVSKIKVLNVKRRKQQRGREGKCIYFNRIIIILNNSKEIYRKFKKCPVQGCTSRPQKRLANHMAIYHTNISPKTMCRFATAVSRRFVLRFREQSKLCVDKKHNLSISSQSEPSTSSQEASSQPSTSSQSSTDQDTSSSHKGKSTTRNMKFFPLSNPHMREFISHLQSMDGGCKSESVSALIAKDISKFLYYSDYSRVNWMSLIDKPKVLKYYNFLKDKCNLGPEGRLTKLERHCDALHYLKLTVKTK